MNKMQGWKTVAGAIVIGIGNAISAYGMPEIGKAIEGVGVALLGIGIAGKLKKLGN